MVITSSGLGGKPSPGFVTYSSSKTFSSFLGQGLNYELKDKIDVLSFECGVVSTKLNKAKVENTVITTADATKECLRHLGYESLTYGHPKSEFVRFYLNNLSDEGYNKLMAYEATKDP